MPKQHELVAIEKEKSSRLNGYKTALYRQMERVTNYFGLKKEYNPDDEEGEQLPSESRRVIRDLNEDLKTFAQYNSDLMDLMVQKDTTNCVARADIIVDGQTIASDIPVTTLLSLEKMLQHHRTVIRSLPTLPLDRVWTLDGASGQWVTDEARTSRSKKVEKPLVLAPATDKHPAQVKTTMVDVKVGTWSKRDLSSAFPVKERKRLEERANKLLDAVKQARERANSVDVVDVSIGAQLSNYLLGE
jgi:hypothetical protein